MEQKTSNMQVAIRIRPLIPSEEERNLRIQWATQNNIIYQIDDSGQKFGEVYSFDYIFGTEKTNVDIYNDIVKDFVTSSLNGLNSTIFAYGQTSSGKTYTMLGNKKDPGVMSLAIENIFDSIESNTLRKFLIRVSYIEIYNEKINDLLDPKNKDVKIRELFSSTIVLQNIKEEIVSSREQMYAYLKRGNLNKHIAATKANDRSSRSHTIFRIMIESTHADDLENGSGAVQVSNLNLVDLAGSERVAQTKATGMRLKEGSHINKSLSALGLVIKQLSDGQEFVNFRDSKLTRLLQDSLGGNSKTLIIATITVVSVEDTASTLAFAQRAKTVKNKPQVNEILSDADVSKRYLALNAQLQKKLDEQLSINQKLRRIQEENSKEMLRLQQQKEQLEDFQHRKKTPTHKGIPKRRHTIGFSAQKSLFSRLPTEQDFIIEEESEDLTLFGDIVKDFSNTDDSFKEFSTPSDGFKDLSTTADKFKDLSTAVEGLETIMEEETIPINNNQCTPEHFLRMRLSSLEKDYNELVLYTKDEENILTETSKKAEDLAKQLNAAYLKIEQIKNQKDGKVDLEEQYRIREQQLSSRITELEKQLNKRNENNNFLDSDNEFTYIMKQLISLQDILSSPNFINDVEKNDGEENSVLQIIEAFNSKVKTSKEIIQNEIAKQIQNFDQVAYRRISLPNELGSFNHLLNELSLFESDIPVELINNMKKEGMDDLKVLIRIYESLLKKNELIGRCSEKMKCLEEYKDKIKALSNEINDLKTCNAQLSVEILEKNKVISELEVTCENLTEETDKFKKECSILDNEVHKLRDEQCEEIDILMQKIQKLNKEMDTYKTQMNEVNSEISHKNTIIKELEKNYANLRNKRPSFEHNVKQEQLTDEIKKLKLTVASQNEKLNTLSEEILTKNRIIEEKENTYAAIKGDNDKCEQLHGKNWREKLDKLQDLRTDIDYDKEINRYKNEIENFNLELVKKEEIVSEMRNKYALVVEERNKLQQEIDKNLDDNKNHLEKIHILRAKIASQNEELDKLNVDIRTQERIIREYENSFAELKSEKECLTEEINQMKIYSEKQYIDEKVRLTQEIDNLDKNNNTLNEKINQFKNQIGQLSLELSEKNKIISKIESKCANMAEKQFKLKQEVSSLEATNELLSSERDKMKKIISCQTEIEGLRSEIMTKNKIIEKYNSVYETMQTEKEVLTKKCLDNEQLLKENEDCLKKSELAHKKETKVLDNEIQTLKTNRDLLTNEKKKLESRLNELLLELRTKNKIISELEDKCVSLSQAQAKLQEKAETSDEVSSLKQKVESLSSEIQEKNNILSEFHQKNSDLLEEIDYLNQKCMSLSQENKHLENEVEQLRGTVDSIQESNSILDQKLKATEIKMQKQKQLLATAQTNVCDLHATLADNMKIIPTVSLYKQQLFEVRTKKAELEKNNEYLMNQIKSLQCQIEGFKGCDKKNDNLESFPKEDVNNLSSINQHMKNILFELIEYFLNEQKSLSVIRQTQQHRDYFKSVLRDIKANHSALKNILKSLQSGDCDLSKTSDILIKCSSNFKDYFNLEKSFLNEQIEVLESSNKAYLEEIIALKDTPQNSSTSDCLDCDNLKSQLSKLKKENVDRMKQIINLEAKMYEEQDKKVEVQYSEWLKFYKESDKMQQIQIQNLQKQIENYKNSIMANKSSVGVQCDLLQDEFSKQEKYNLLKFKCQPRKDEIAAVMRGSITIKSSVSNVTDFKTEGQNEENKENMCSIAVQCETLNSEKYNLMKRVCINRKEEIVVLKTQLAALKNTQ